jgi:hypothetical protein
MARKPASTTRKTPAGKKAPTKSVPAQSEEPPVDPMAGIHPAARPFLWLGSHKVQHNFIWLIGALALAFVAADFFIHRHGHFEWEKIHGSYAIFGFLAFTFVVLMGWPLRKLTGRDESYYGDGDQDD